MHAVVVTVTILDRPGSQVQLNELVPQVSAAPGFIAGYWIDLSRDEGISVAVFNSEAAAQDVAAQIKASAGDKPVTLDTVAVGEVVGHA